MKGINSSNYFQNYLPLLRIPCIHDIGPKILHNPSPQCDPAELAHHFFSYMDIQMTRSNSSDCFQNDLPLPRNTRIYDIEPLTQRNL